MSTEQKTVAVVGGSSYAGGEFLRLALGHPHLEMTQVTSEDETGLPVSMIYPHLRGATHLKFCREADLAEADIVVLALPQGVAAERLADFEAKGKILIDLSGDFRLRDAEVYEQAYSKPHPTPDKLGDWVYGLPELRRDQLRGATRIACAGAFATSVVLPLYPLLRLGALAPKDIVVTGLLGRSESVRQLVSRLDTAEAAQVLPGRFPLQLSAVPAPYTRGILTSIQAWVPDGWSDKDAWTAYREIYGTEPFIRIVKAADGPYRFPDPALLSGTNFCDIGFEMDMDTGRLVVLSALDNLVKGAAGSAVQSLNIAQGWEERTGLEFLGLPPA